MPVAVLAEKQHIMQEKGCKSIIGVDIDDKYIEYARQFAKEKGILNAQFKVSEINDLPFESDTFDLIF